MQANLSQHAGEEALERYSLGTLPESELEPFEEHLLICSTCQDRLTEVDAYIEAVRTAAAKLRQGHRSSQRGFASKLRQMFDKPGLAWAAGLALLPLLAAWFSGLWLFMPSRSPNSPLVAVTLQSARGGDGLAGVRAPEGEFLLLQVDLAELPVLPAYRLEIVNGRGSPIWKSTARPRDGKLSVPITKVLKDGRYWVRLYAAGRQKGLLREFGLSVE